MQNIFCGLLFLTTTAHAARILGIFPRPATSQLTFHEAVMKSLVSAGHNVTIIAPFPLKVQMENFTVINDYIIHSMNTSARSLPDIENLSFLRLMRIALDGVEKYCHDVTEMTKIQDILNSKEKLFDVMFVEFVPMYECYLPIAQKLSIPVIGTTSLRDSGLADQAVGNSQNPSVHPFIMLSLGQKMTFYQRILNSIYYVISKFAYYYMEYPRLKRFYDQYYPEIHSMESKKMSLVFYNNHPAVFSRALTPNSVNIGGVHVKLAKINPLPNNLKKFIDESENGVILFTFGSIITSKNLNMKLKDIFRDVFAEIPQRVVWKFEEDIEGLSSNVLLQKWVPQKEILGHKNVIAFISHCGISGTYESIYAGKPIVMIPFFADQLAISANLIERGVGVQLNSKKLTKEMLLRAINEVINNTDYTNNMRKLSKAFNDDPIPLNKTIVYWTEYVIEHNNAFHLRTVEVDMPLYQYLLLDVIIFVAAVFLLAVLFVYYASKKLFRFFFAIIRKRVSIEKEKKIKLLYYDFR